MDRPAPSSTRGYFSLRSAASSCQNIPSYFVDLDASALPPGLLNELAQLETWRDVKALLNEDAPAFLPVERPIDTGDPIRENRAQPLGGGEAEDWLANATDSEKLAAACKLSSNPLAFDLLTGRGLPGQFKFRELASALKDLSAQLLEWPETTIGTVPRVERLEQLPRMSADDVLRSIAGKVTTTAVYLSRYAVVPLVSVYAGVGVFERESQFFLKIDSAEFLLGRDFIPDNETAREILHHWERTGGSRHELYELTPEEERCIPMLLGLVQYKSSAGIHRFSVTTPPQEVARIIPSIHDGLREATAIVMKFDELLETWAPPSQFIQDHIPLFAEMCRLTKVDWSTSRLVDSQDKYLQYYEQALATLDFPGQFSEAEVTRYSVIERMDQLLKRAAKYDNIEDMLKAFEVPQAKVGSYVLTSDAAEVMKRLHASRNSVRNTYDQREKLFHGNTHPGLPFGSPDGSSTYLKVREVLNRLYNYNPEYRQLDHVLMGIGYTLAMENAFPKNTTFCDLEIPKGLAGHANVDVVDALSMRRPDGSLLDIEDKVYISDIYGGKLKPANHYMQVDTIIAGRPACGAIKCFIDNPGGVVQAAEKLSCNYMSVFYCGVTKAHTGEFFLCFSGLKPHAAEQSRTIQSKTNLFIALHSVRTDVANYFYNGHVRAGVLDFSHFKRIDAVLQRHGAPFIGKAWSRTVPIHEISHVMGRKARAGAAAPTETLTLTELAKLEEEAERVAMEHARAAAKGKTKSGSTSGTKVDIVDLDDVGSETPPPESEVDSSYGTAQYTRHK